MSPCTYASEANFVSEAVEATNADLRVANVVELGKAKARRWSVSINTAHRWKHTPCKHQC